MADKEITRYFPHKNKMLRGDGTITAKTIGAHQKGDYQFVQIWRKIPPDPNDDPQPPLNPDEMESAGFKILAYNRYANIGSDKFVEIVWDEGGFYKIIAGEC